MCKRTQKAFSNWCKQHLTPGELPFCLESFTTIQPHKKGSTDGVESTRPFYPVNVLAKIVIGIYSKQIKPILHRIITKTQTRFASSRTTTENIRMAQEVMYWCKIHHSEATFSSSDLAKEYDRAQWLFLKRTLLRKWALVWDSYT